MWKDGAGNSIPDIKVWIKQNLDSNEFDNVALGCDAGRSGADMNFISAIVLDRKGSKGSIFAWKSCVEKKWGNSLAKKLLKEAELIVELVELTQDFNINKEAHIDINTQPSAGSNTFLSTIRGWIESMGIAVIPKPNGYASSSVADKYN